MLIVLIAVATLLALRPAHRATYAGRVGLVVSYNLSKYSEREIQVQFAHIRAAASRGDARTSHGT